MAVCNTHVSSQLVWAVLCTVAGEKLKTKLDTESARAAAAEDAAAGLQREVAEANATIQEQQVGAVQNLKKVTVYQQHHLPASAASRAQLLLPALRSGAQDHRRYLHHAPQHAKTRQHTAHMCPDGRPNPALPPCCCSPQGMLEKVGKETMSMRDAMSKLKAQALEFAVKAQKDAEAAAATRAQAEAELSRVNEELAKERDLVGVGWIGCWAWMVICQHIWLCWPCGAVRLGVCFARVVCVL